MQSLAVALVIICILFPILSAGILGLRLGARRIKNASIQLEDYIVIAAWIISAAMAIANIIAVYAGHFGEPEAYEDFDDLTLFTKILFALQFFHISSVALTKASILIFYKKLFATRKFMFWANILLLVVGAWFIAFFFTTLFQAWPISHNWTGIGVHLLNEPSMYLALGITDLLTDVAILLMPLPIIHMLHISTTKKIMVGGIFGTGFFCIAASGVRTYYLNIVNSSSFQDINAYAWYMVDYVIWTQIEVCWSIICASLPLLMPYFQNRKTLATMVDAVKSMLSLRSASSTNSVGARKTSEEDSSRETSLEAGQPTISTRREAYEILQWSRAL